MPSCNILQFFSLKSQTSRERRCSAWRWACHWRCFSCLWNRWEITAPIQSSLQQQRVVRRTRLSNGEGGTSRVPRNLYGRIASFIGGHGRRPVFAIGRLWEDRCAVSTFIPCDIKINNDRRLLIRRHLAEKTSIDRVISCRMRRNVRCLVSRISDDEDRVRYYYNKTRTSSAHVQVTTKQHDVWAFNDSNLLNFIVSWERSLTWYFTQAMLRYCVRFRGYWLMLIYI